MSKYGFIENLVTIVSCVACVVGLAAFTDGYWGWGFLLLFNINSVKSGN
jgi:hypothetical protein